MEPLRLAWCSVLGMGNQPVGYVPWCFALLGKPTSLGVWFRPICVAKMSGNSQLVVWICGSGM